METWRCASAGCSTTIQIGGGAVPLSCPMCGRSMFRQGAESSIGAIDPPPPTPMIPIAPDLVSINAAHWNAVQDAIVELRTNPLTALESRIATASLAELDELGQRLESIGTKIVALSGTLVERAAQLKAPPRERRTCKVCRATEDDDGAIEHGRGCYQVSEDGGGTEWTR